MRTEGCGQRGGGRGLNKPKNLQTSFICAFFLYKHHMYSYMPPKVVPKGKAYLARDDEMPLWGEPFGIGMDEGLERERNASRETTG